MPVRVMNRKVVINSIAALERLGLPSSVLHRPLSTGCRRKQTPVSHLQTYNEVSFGRSVRHMSTGRINTFINFVPQQEAWVIERFGKFHRTLEPGLNVIIPVIETIKHVQSLKEITIEVPKQNAVTADNVTLTIDGVLYIRVTDPYKASYGVQDAEFAVSKLAQTTMRSELGKISLDTVFKERELLNIAIVEQINNAAIEWGLDIKRYEILDIILPSQVQIAMQMQVEAERKKRATILESEGVRQSNVNVAEGEKTARILRSEAYMSEQINQAKGEAEAILQQARAKSQAIELLAQALAQQNGQNAVSMRMAEQYIEAFGKLAKETNTILLPSNTGDITSMVAQAMSIYKNLGSSPTPPSTPTPLAPSPHTPDVTPKHTELHLQDEEAEIEEEDVEEDVEEKPTVPRQKIHHHTEEDLGLPIHKL